MPFVISRLSAFLPLLCALLFFCAPAKAAAPGGGIPKAGAANDAASSDAAPKQAQDQALDQALRRILKENPDIVLDVLKDNSELVLEIAQQGNMLRKRKAMLAQWETDAKNHKDPDLKGRAFRGPKNAPVTIVAYSDFTCPYCRQAEYILLEVMKKYPDKIRVTFKPLPKDDPFSQAAAKYSLAAFRLDEDKGWKFFDLLFRETEQYEREGDDFLKQAAAGLGFDFRKLNAEAGTPELQAMLEADRKEADRFGISGTPHFLVNDLLVRGAVSKELFEEAVNMALALKK